MWIQKHIHLKPRARGFHLITDEIVAALPELNRLHVGVANLFIRHTSASLTINENADPTVRLDFESYFNRAVPENVQYFRHTYEGADDMPAHLKNSIIGCSLTIPIEAGRLSMGNWQGIYLCEHRDSAGSRDLLVTLNGE